MISKTISKVFVNCDLSNLSYMVCNFNNYVVFWGTCSHWTSLRDQI